MHMLISHFYPLHFLCSSEPPPPREVTAVPLDDNSLEVRWTAPANRLVSGFVVEWFAARESTDVVLHWQQLNNSCRSLVITGKPTTVCVSPPEIVQRLDLDRGPDTW